MEILNTKLYLYTVDSSGFTKITKQKYNINTKYNTNNANTRKITWFS